MNRYLCAVSVFVYKKNPNLSELTSFCQALNVFRNRDVFIVKPKNLPLENYHFNGTNVSIIELEDRYFESIHSYNRLMMSNDFYINFIKYNYILIYQLDAWAFTDDLNKICADKYDYIGAPWIDRNGRCMKYAGNGGFSLRKVSTFIRVISDCEKKNVKISILSAINILLFSRFNFHSMRMKLKDIFNIIYFSDKFIKNYEYNEDLFFCFLLVSLGYRVAEQRDAMNFSFEVSPEKLFIKNNNKLPMGCHGFTKYSQLFWKQYMPIEAFNLKDGE